MQYIKVEDMIGAVHDSREDLHLSDIEGEIYEGTFSEPFDIPIEVLPHGLKKSKKDRTYHTFSRKGGKQ